ncbi:uncharacterized protein N7483_009910 [Penicillium malachiteum]|uniref:uncharacterized protein n=1 Tax=Penicillium malachiteum TaxID=1324776 RepID=UPI0025481AC7|nr:uncharacterized protein N7483_009910 [Penicillium malachiteum]KAJ5718828.1 hypothetical protein N7483_009910 [Penicillium malachiteum]
MSSAEREGHLSRLRYGFRDRWKGQSDKRSSKLPSIGVEPAKSGRAHHKSPAQSKSSSSVGAERTVTSEAPDVTTKHASIHKALWENA